MRVLERGRVLSVVGRIVVAGAKDGRDRCYTFHTHSSQVFQGVLTNEVLR
jgi:hypothetical protein